MDSVNFDKSAFNVNVKIDQQLGLFDYDTFIHTSGYPFDNTYLLAYEPERNMFVVERTGGVIETGESLPEIEWIKNNLQNIKNLIPNHSLNNRTFIITVEMERNTRLYATDWMITRQVEETMSNNQPSLTVSQYQKLIEYRQFMRDVTKTYARDADSATVIWPNLDL